MSMYQYYDIRARVKSSDLDLLFPQWQGSDERLAIVSPHDDDALLGAGYLISAARDAEASVYVIIVCNGCAGYSSPEEKATIVATRQKETLAAYGHLKLDENHIVRFDYDDFSIWPFLGWHLPGGETGTLEKMVKALRELRITRLVIPNGYREHIDHEGAFKMAAYDGPQAGDPILAEWGPPQPLTPSPAESVLQYSVWGDFSPEDALVNGFEPVLRANRILHCSPDVEERIVAAIKEYRSQSQIIANLVAARQSRRTENGYVELYLAWDPRPALDYSPYVDFVNNFR